MWDRRVVVSAGLIGLLAFGITLFWTRPGISNQVYTRNQAYSGDEPHYLIIAESLRIDHDLNLKQDYQIGTYRPFYPNGALEPHVNVDKFDVNAPAWYSIHSPGFPAYLYPWLRLFGLNGITWGLAVLAAVFGILLFLWSYVISKKLAGSILASLVFLVSPAFVDLANTVYPDIMIACVLLLAMLLVAGKQLSKRRLAALGSVVAVAPFIHPKLIFPLAALVLWELVRLQRRNGSWTVQRGSYAALLLPIIIGGGVYLAFLLHFYDAITPAGMYAKANQLKFNPVTGFLASLFDGSRGILTNNPLLFLVLPAIGVLAATNKRLLIKLGLMTIPLIILTSARIDWGGYGLAPTGRYWLSLMVLLAPGMALLLSHLRRRAVWIIIALATVAQITLIVVMVSTNTFWVTAGNSSPIFQAIKDSIGLSIHSFVPNFTINTEFISTKDALVIIPYVALSAALVWIGWRSAKNVKKTAKVS